MKKLSVFILIILSTMGCKTGKPVEFLHYYDKEKTQLSAKGFILDDKEIGNWYFYEENGRLYKQSNYFEGYLKGISSYYDSTVKKEVSWKEIKDSASELHLSLPENFVATKCSGMLFCAQDTSKNDFVAIELHQYINDSSFSKLFDTIKTDLLDNFSILEYKFFKIVTEKDSYYYNYFILNSKTDTMQKLVIYGFLCRFGNKIIGMAYRINYYKASPFDHTIFADIFQHMYIQNKRVNNPFFMTKRITQIYL